MIDNFPFLKQFPKMGEIGLFKGGALFHGYDLASQLSIGVVSWVFSRVSVDHRHISLFSYLPFQLFYPAVA
jgi:hypothetical protein